MRRATVDLRAVAVGIALAIVLAACAPGPGAKDPVLLLATTTSTQDSGLLDVLIPAFEKAQGYRVRTSAVGTGQALEIGARGDADVVLAHAPETELQYMASGNFSRRLLVMHNDFILVGPPSDPAHVRGKNAYDALGAIAAARATFISRGDRSGTDILEKSLWTKIAIMPSRPWYVEAGVGMGQTLTIASEKVAYTLTDRGTFLARRDPLQLAILVEKDPPLVNRYHVMTVNAARFPRVNGPGADAFADFLVSAEGQSLIGAFGVSTFGQPLFFPDAGGSEDDIH